MTESKDHSQGTFDLPEVVKSEQSVRVAKSGRVNSAELLDQDACPLAPNLDLGTEGSRQGARRSRRDDHSREAEELFRLDNNAEALARLLMAPHAAGRSEAKDLTPLHAGRPSTWRSAPFRRGLSDQR